MKKYTVNLLVLLACTVTLMACRELEQMQVVLDPDGASAKFSVAGAPGYIVIQEIGVTRLDCSTDCVVWSVAKTLNDPEPRLSDAVDGVIVLGQVIPGATTTDKAKPLAAGKYAVMMQAFNVKDKKLLAGVFYGAQFTVP